MVGPPNVKIGEGGEGEGRGDNKYHNNKYIELLFIHPVNIFCIKNHAIHKIYIILSNYGYTFPFTSTCSPALYTHIY